MHPERRLLATAALFATVMVVASLGVILRGQAEDSPGNQAQDRDGNSEQWKIQQGFRIAPVPLNLKGKDRDLVGLGSFIVNGVADCNGCHTAAPQTEYLASGNPYFGEPAKINPATYLGGGQDFGKVGPPPSPDIISRNLTPDKTGRAEGGRSFQEFLQIIRTGVDLDNLHPNCSTTVTTNCFPTATYNPANIPGLAPPYTDGALLQVMPWPVHRNMPYHDLLAIYTYLSAIPCLSTGKPGDVLYNDCGP
jgi:hypothetical protein